MEIDKRIINDSEFLKDLDLCQLRLYKDGDLAWFLLVPRVSGIIEWTDLLPQQQIVLTQEIDYVCNLLKKYIKPDKINIGTLGNMVPQMHIHIIGRYKNDRAWPGAVWGTKSRKSFQSYMTTDWKDRIG